MHILCVLHMLIFDKKKSNIHQSGSKKKKEVSISFSINLEFPSMSSRSPVSFPLLFTCYHFYLSSVITFHSLKETHPYIIPVEQIMKPYRTGFFSGYVLVSDPVRRVSLQSVQPSVC